VMVWPCWFCLTISSMRYRGGHADQSTVADPRCDRVRTFGRIAGAYPLRATGPLRSARQLSCCVLCASCHVVSCAPAVMLCVVRQVLSLAWLPRTPRWLLTHGLEDEATKSLLRILGSVPPGPWDWAHPCPHPHLPRDLDSPCHISAGTRLVLPTSAPGPSWPSPC
jgi:hypothetical protein